MAQSAMTQQCLNLEEAEPLPYEALESNYLIAGLRVQLCFETIGLKRQITPTFEHLQTNVTSEAPALTVSVGRIFDLPPWPLGPTGILISGNEASTVIREHEGRVVSVLENGGAGRWSTLDFEAIPCFQLAAPMRKLLNLWMARQGRYVVHSAAVAHAGHGVLIVGKGGSGKSTTSLSCAIAGMQYAGDDHCLLSGGESPFVHSLYSTAKLAVDGFKRFPTLLEGVGGTISGPEVDKLLCYLQRVRGTNLTAGFPLRAILLARIANEKRTRLVRATAAQGFRALAPSIALQVPNMRGDALRYFNLLVRSVPIYELQLGWELTSAPDAITEFLNMSR